MCFQTSSGSCWYKCKQEKHHCCRRWVLTPFLVLSYYKKPLLWCPAGVVRRISAAEKVKSPVACRNQYNCKPAHINPPETPGHLTSGGWRWQPRCLHPGMAEMTEHTHTSPSHHTYTHTDTQGTHTPRTEYIRHTHTHPTENTRITSHTHTTHTHSHSHKYSPTVQLSSVPHFLFCPHLLIPLWAALPRHHIRAAVHTSGSKHGSARVLGGPWAQPWL